eukprot:SAG31_NODE_28_length_32713_cov_39.100509_23_plen_334_part_01
MAARTQNVTLFVPLGCYVVTNTLRATEPRNGRWQPVVIVGQRPPAGERPPTLHLPPDTAAFGDPNATRPLLLFITNWCLAPGPGLSVPALGCNTSAQPPSDWHSSAYQFNQALQGVDLLLGHGNPGAVGIAMAAAQGSVLEDVTVYAAPDSAAGVAGGNGGGGSFKGVTVVGGKYGVDMRATGCSATYLALTLINQTCAAALMDSRSTMTATGMRISGSPKLAGVLAGVHPEMLHPDSGCHTGQTSEITSLLRESSEPVAVLQSAASIVDSSIALAPSTLGQTACLRADSSLYVSVCPMHRLFPPPDTPPPPPPPPVACRSFDCIPSLSLPWGE